MIIEHHIKYKEIHGVDETIWMERSEHDKLHRRLRKEGKCNIPPNELNKISHRAKNRTTKFKARRTTIQLTDTVKEHVQLVEEHSYDNCSGHTYCRVRFRANNGLHLKYIDV